MAQGIVNARSNSICASGYPVVMLGNRHNFLAVTSIIMMINVVALLYITMHMHVGRSSHSGLRLFAARLNSSGRNPSNKYVNRYIRHELLRRSVNSTISSDKTREPLSISSSCMTEHIAASNTSYRPRAVRDSILNINTLTAAPPYDETLDFIEEYSLSPTTLARLREYLDCTDQNFFPQTVQRGSYWVLKNYIRAEHGKLQCHETITYTTHATFDFLDNVEELVKRWMGPISLAVFAPGATLVPTMHIIRYLRYCLNHDLVRQFVTFHIFFPFKHVPKKIPNLKTFMTRMHHCRTTTRYEMTVATDYMKTNNLLYPVNVARNIARDAALTHYILPSDIELYPSPHLIPRFLNMIVRNINRLKRRSKQKVFPLSIFEVVDTAPVPSTKAQLRQMLYKKTAIPFHKYLCPACHEMPRAAEWIKANKTDRMDIFHVAKRQGPQQHWEPIYIGTHADPHYDERLSWEGKMDKMTQGYILCVKDYDFMILNNAFLVHKPGIKYSSQNRQRDHIAARQSSLIRKSIFPELVTLFGSRNGCSL